MHKVDVDYQRSRELVDSGRFPYRALDITTRQEYTDANYKSLPVKEVLDWLYENVGYELNMFRIDESLVYEDMNKRNNIFASKTYDEWNANNPIIPENLRNWTIDRNGNFYFKSLEHATLFKLRWF